MTTTINGRTPEEIKHGLECCSTTGKCEECAYAERCAIVAEEDPRMWFGEPVMKDALAYIQQLDRERDAAVEAAHGACKACIHYNGAYPPGDIMSCCKFEECLYGMDEWDAEDHWQWRGPQEVE